ncbi:Maleylacetoacetate isomerase [Podospora conica]|nr:Maleylacetoacetate isomerase [Schizothecium conicum]
MSSDEIVLFDIPTKGPRRTPWSYNPFKARLLLNYKGIPFRTEWLEYPEIGPRLQGHVPPIPDDTPAYTLPATRFPGDLYVMDSLAIAQYINTTYPSPPLPITTPEYEPFRTLARDIMVPLHRALQPLVFRRLLSPESQAFWRLTREPEHGMTMEELEARHVTDRDGWNKAWEAAREPTAGMTALLAAKGGPFFQGSDVSWPDLVWGSTLLFFEKIGDDVLGAFLDGAGEGREVHLRLLEAVRGWTGGWEE